MQALQTSDYSGGQPWPGKEDEEDSYPFPLVMKVRSRASSVRSGASTPGGGAFRSLSEDDLREADTALSHVQTDAMVAKLNGAH
jgi:glycogen(starch) synthase